MADPLSATATLISIVGFSAQVFDGCIKGFILLSNARNLGKDADILRTMLDWEQLRLRQWGDSVGLQDPALADPNLDWKLIQTTLETLRNMMLDAEGLKKRYGLVLQEEAEYEDWETIESEGLEKSKTKSSVTVDEGEKASRFKALFSIGSNINSSTTAQIINLKTSPVKKLRWAAVDKKTMEKLLHDISHLTTRLYDTLNTATQSQILANVESILKEAASWTAISSDLQVLRHLAARTGGIDKAEIEPDIQKRYNQLLFHALDKNDLAKAESLLDEGADVLGKDHVGWPPLVLTARDGNLDATKLLLRRGADPNIGTIGRKAYHLAAENGHAEVVDLLLQQPLVDVNAKDFSGQTMLHKASRQKYEKVVVLLLEQEGIETDSMDDSGWTPLMCAMGSETAAVIRLLLARPEVNPNVSLKDHGQTPLWMSVTQSNKEIIKMLLARPDIDVNKIGARGHSPLWQAARWSEDTALQLLHEKGADIDQPNEEGQTPLCIAAIRGNESILQILLDHPTIQIDQADKSGKTPLIASTEAGQLKCVRHLLSHNASPSAYDREGRTALSWATAKGYKIIAKVLLKANAHIDHKDNNGNTPLALAVNGGHEAVVRFLLENGADAEIADEDEETPFEKARDAKMAGVVEIFKETLKI